MPAVAFAACLAALVSARPAMGARPTPGAHYFGFPAGTSTTVGLLYGTAELRVSRDGHRLAGAKLQLTCRRRDNAEAVELEQMRISFRFNPDARIRRDGSFKLARGHGRRRFRLAGRFVTAQEARLFYSASERRRLSVCRPEKRKSKAVLYRGGVPPFSGCASQRARTLASSETARVLEQYMAPAPSRRGLALVGFFPHVYACLFASPSKRYDLGQNYDDATLDTFRLAGPMLAFLRGGCFGACIFEQRYIEVRDLRDGSLVSRPDVPQWSRLYDLALKDNGALGWTLDRLAIGPNGDPVGYPNEPPVVVAREIWALDNHGQRLLDSNLNLALDSLEINGSTVYWLDGTTPRSATID